MRKRINIKLLLGFISPYLLIVLIVFGIQYVSNSFVLKALKNNVVEIIETSFKDDIGVIEHNLGNVKEIAAIVAQNTAKKANSLDKDDSDYYSQLTAIKKELSSYYTGGNIIRDICIQNDEKDFLINFSSAYSKRIYYYQNSISYPDNSPEKLLESSEKANGFSIDNICHYPGGMKAVPFFYPTPLLKQRTGSVSVYVDENALLIPVDDLLKKSEGVLYVANKEGQAVLLSGNKNIELKNAKLNENLKRMSINNEWHYVFKEIGNASKWEYTVLLPEKYVLNKVENYQLISLIFNFIILIIGFAICLFFTTRKSRSYAGLLDVLEIKPEIKSVKELVLNDEYEGLSKHISRIKDENTILLEKGTQSVLRQILNGQLEKDDEILKELKHHKVDLSGPLFGVAVVRYSTENASEKIAKNADSLILGKIREIIPDSRVCFIEKNIAAVLFSSDEVKFIQSAKGYADKINGELKSRFSIDTIVGIGTATSSPGKIADSYAQAFEVIKYKFLTNNNDLYFYEHLPDGDDYFYPLETESSLFKSVRESDYESARKVLQEIYEENFVKRSLCVDAINELIAELRASIKKICRMQTEYLEFSNKEASVVHFFENATSVLYIVCSDNEEKETQSKGQKLCREAKNYIELYYNNPNLSLDVIADEFRLHPNYLSALFKKHTGSNIISYLEAVRIEKSIELLSSGKYTVNEVAASVGFSNDGTFRRCFKKNKGVSPSSYLKY